MTDAVLPLDGLRVVDLTEDVGELCGRLLSDLGADVVRVEPPGGSPTRSRPPVAPDGTGLWWQYRNAGKRGIVLDPRTDAGAARLRGLLASADVVLDSARRGERPAGLDAASLASSFPHLVVASLTWFGLEGPYAAYAATDDVVVAMSGWLSSSGRSTDLPLLVPDSLASDAAGTMGVFAVLAALWQRRVTGRGQLLDLSAFEATIQVDTWAVPNASAIVNAGMDARRVRSAEDSLYPTIATRDGFVRLVMLSPRQWRALWEWMGSPEAFADPYWEQTFARFENRDVLHPIIGEFFSTMGMIECAIEAQRRGVVVVPILKPDDILVDEHYRSRDTFVPLEVAPGVEAPVMAGFFEIDARRVRVRDRAPRVGEHDAAVTAGELLPERAVGVSATDRAGAPTPAAGPFSGLRVVDFGHGGVGVQGAMLFAEHGADVIKVESRAYPDFMRKIMGGEMTPSFAASSRGKRSFGVDLKRPEGLALVKQLVASADVVIENNSTGTMDDLGVGWKDLRAIKPDLVYVSSQLLGSRGTRAGWIGYGPSVQAYGGLTHLWSYRNGDPVGGNANYPDLLVGHLCALAGLAGLLRREVTGTGAHCELAQVDTVVGTLGDLIMAEGIAPGSVVADGNDDARGAPWGVFRCAGNEDWCVICVRDDDDWVALCKAMGNPAWAVDDRWTKAAGRLAGRAELNRLVDAWTAELSPVEVARVCQEHGVAAGPMLYPYELLTDAHLAQRGFLGRFDQPGAGRLTVETAAFRPSDMAPPHVDAAPLLGEHTREICVDVLGMEPADVDRLIAGGVLEEALVSG